MPSNNLMLKIILALITTLVLLTHCAPQREILVREDEKEILRKRCNEYWQYQMNVNAEKAYQFEVPEFREKVSLLEYAQRHKLVRYLEVNISKIELEEDRGRIPLEITYHMFLKQMQKKLWKRKEVDQWIKIKDLWYHIPQEFELAKK